MHTAADTHRAYIRTNVSFCDAQPDEVPDVESTHRQEQKSRRSLFLWHWN